MNWKQATCIWALGRKKNRVRRVLRRACQADQERASIYRALAERESGDSPWQILLPVLAEKALTSAAGNAAALRRQGGEARPFEEHWLFRARRWCLLHCRLAQAVCWLEHEESRKKQKVLTEMLDLRDSLRIVTGR